MDRRDLKRLAELRLDEARALLDRGLPAGAYYLAGYAVECALKAAFAKTIKEDEFPDLKRVNQAYTHNLSNLLRLTELDQKLREDARTRRQLDNNWALVRDWSEKSRYEEIRLDDATALVEAVEDPKEGVLSWLKQHW